MSVRRQSRFLGSGWQSLPTDEAGLREAEPSFDEAQTLCDLGWQSQPTIDHNLYTKYLETGRLTLTKHLLYYNTIVLHKTLFIGYLELTLSCSHLPIYLALSLGWMA